MRAMCELFGVSAQNDFYANDYLKLFYSHSDFHPHGWGLACVSRNGALVEKESVKASNSNYLREGKGLHGQKVDADPQRYDF